LIVKKFPPVFLIHSCYFERPIFQVSNRATKLININTYSAKIRKNILIVTNHNKYHVSKGCSSLSGKPEVKQHLYLRAFVETLNLNLFSVRIPMILRYYDIQTLSNQMSRKSVSSCRNKYFNFNPELLCVLQLQ